MAKRAKKISCIMAGGGTGGHLFPALAVSRELEARVEQCSITFVLGKRGRGEKILRAKGFEVSRLNVEGMKGRGLGKALAVSVRLPSTLFDSMKIIRAKKADLVFGVGGYSAGPVCTAAKALGVPMAIHEQNAFPGITNRLLSRIADKVFISFEDSKEYLKGPEPLVVGTPIRQELLSRGDKQTKGSKSFTLLVLGGSQGARAINQAMVEAVPFLGRDGRKLNVIHQTGEHDYDRVRRDYEDMKKETASNKITIELYPFIEDMAWAYGEADLVVSRAGASTLFELAALAKPSILVPYPFAANNHQEMNTKAMARAGGALLITQKELSGPLLAETIAGLMNNQARLKQMAEAARCLARPEAASRIAEQLLELVI